MTRPTATVPGEGRPMPQVPVWFLWLIAGIWAGADLGGALLFDAGSIREALERIGRPVGFAVIATLYAYIKRPAPPRIPGGDR